MEKSLEFFSPFFWEGAVEPEICGKNIITNVLRLFLVYKSTIRKRLIKPIYENDKKHK